MNKIFTFIMAMLMTASLLMTGCAKSEPKTLEDIVSTDEEVAEEINKGAADSGIQVDIKDNTVTYTYDISSVEGVTDEMIEDEEFVQSFQKSLDSQASAFADVCASLEKKTGISGVLVNVVYLYGDKEIAKSTYTSADAAKSGDSGSSDDSDESDSEDSDSSESDSDD